MPTLTLEVTYKINKELVISPTDLQAFYLSGLLSKVNTTLPDEAYEHLIMAAQKEVEKTLGIKLQRQIIDESFDFYLDDFRHFSFIPTTYPVVEAFTLNGYLAQVKQIEYPTVWLSSRKTSDGETYYRQIFLVPAQNAVVQVGGVSMAYSGVMSSVGVMSFKNIPNYWNLVYCTGFEKIPQDIIGVIGKLAAVGVLSQLGNLVLGVPGASSTSLSIDGLSQSTSVSNPFREQIKGYLQDIENSMKRLTTYYRGITLVSM